MPSNTIREVQPEILDELPHDDPAAQRSRRDLQRINIVMGNDQRILQAVRSHPNTASRGIVEIGAGDGTLIQRLAQQFPSAPASAHDLAPRPQKLDSRIHWHQGDIFNHASLISGGILVANLFLHHFMPDGLRQIGQICSKFDLLVFNEPNRAMLPHVLAMFGWPFINTVTRHDMHVSIDAGFQQRELTKLLELDEEKWEIRETSSWRGARCVVASHV